MNTIEKDWADGQVIKVVKLIGFFFSTLLAT